MAHEKGKVITECFYWNEEEKHFYSMGREKKGCSLNFFLEDVCFVDAQIIPGANRLVLFYTK